MPLFLDSNVILGFCFAGIDKWGRAAKAVMETSDTKYTSKGVREECFGDDELTGGKAGTILKNLRKQVHKLCACLNQPNCELDLKDLKKDPRFLLIAKQVSGLQDKNRDEMIDCVRTLQHNVEKAYNQKKARLSEQLNLHTRREAYRKLYVQLKSEISNSDVELDPDDLEIILDAHDLALIIDGLILVTGDQKHVVAAKDIICQNTEICEVQDLEEYTPIR